MAMYLPIFCRGTISGAMTVTMEYMPDPPIPCSARKMILKLVLRSKVPSIGSSSQLKHVLNHPANNREGGEQHKGHEHHRLSTKDITEFRIDDEEAYCPSQVKIVRREN